MMRLKILFGMALDGVRWSKSEASVGEYTCGPKGMLQLLETRLGLTGEDASSSDRIRAYQGKICIANPMWCRASFEKDAWGVSARLLSMRDELVMMGWRGEGNPNSDRIEALAQIEAISQKVPPGMPDRLWTIARTSPRDGTWAELTFADDISLYPHVWKEIFKRHFSVDFAGACEVDVSSADKPKCDVQTPDLTIVTAPDEMRLAVTLARYLKAGSSEENHAVAVIAENDTTLLDGVLSRYGLPALGRSSSSIYREALEIVPLWVANMWNPFSPQQLVALLTMSFGPMSPRYANKLVRALNEEPGIGGDAWQKAWDEDIPESIDAAKSWKDGVRTDEPLSALKKTELRNRMAAVRSVLENDRYDPEEGIPIVRLREVLALVKTRFDALRARIMAEAKRSGKVKNERMIGLGVACGQIKELLDALESYPDRKIAKPQLDGILASIAGYGLGQYDVHEEVSDCRFVRNPGQIVETIETVLWWDFTDRSSVRRTAWLADEIGNLPGKDDDANRVSRELAAWQCAYRRAGRHLVCFLPERKDGKCSVPHPYFDNLAALVGGTDAIKTHMISADALARGGEWGLAGRTMPLRMAEAPGRKLQQEPGVVVPNDGLKPAKMSASQMDMLVACPYQWYLKYHLKLKESSLNDILSDSLVKGKLAHKVMERLLSTGRAWTPDDAAEESVRLFDALLPQMAATFGVVERKEECAQFKRELRAAVRAFIVEINARNLAWEAGEIELSEPMNGEIEKPELKFEGVPFGGRVDLVLHDKDDPSKKFIVDFKWSKRDDKYKDATTDGTAVQLAAYDWMLNRTRFGSRTGYYIFPSKMFIESEQDNADTWDVLRKTYGVLLKEMQSGTVYKGYPEEMFEGLALGSGKKKLIKAYRAECINRTGRFEFPQIDKAPSCRFCPFRVLCGDIDKYVPVRNAENGGAQ